MNKKIKFSQELSYFVSIIVLAFAVSLMSAANFGLSMIVAPAYILSQKLTFLTFGQCEYLLQGIFFIVFCILMKKIKIQYFTSFLTCIIYGFFVDLWRKVIPILNPDITPPGSMDFYIRIIFFILGMLLTAMSVALCFKTYLPPQVYDYFVKEISQRFNIDRTIFKRCFDAFMLILGTVLTLVFFRKFIGVTVITVFIALTNGVIIGFFDKLYDKIFDFVPTFSKICRKFDN
ncbi:MAG: hypothetical protein IJP21_06135 [Clostridia bacterium]|nr:hypothetical protein [Clostridia bacterium]